MATKKNFKQSAAEMFISSASDPDGTEPATAPEIDLNSINVPEGYIIRRESKNQRMQILVRPSTKKNLEEEASKRNTSMNDVINTIVEAYFRERKVRDGGI